MSIKLVAICLLFMACCPVSPCDVNITIEYDGVLHRDVIDRISAINGKYGISEIVCLSQIDLGRAKGKSGDKNDTQNTTLGSKNELKDKKEDKSNKTSNQNDRKAPENTNKTESSEPSQKSIPNQNDPTPSQSTSQIKPLKITKSGSNTKTPQTVSITHTDSRSSLCSILSFVYELTTICNPSQDASEVSRSFSGHSVTFTTSNNTEDFIQFISFRLNHTNDDRVYILHFREDGSPQEDHMTLYDKYNDRTLQYVGTIGDKAEMDKFLSSNSNPELTMFDSYDSPSKVLGRELPVLFLFMTDTSSEKFAAFADAGVSLRNRILFAFAPMNNQIVDRLVGHLKLTDYDIGTGLWILKARWGSVIKFRFNHDELTTENIKDFIESYYKGNIQQYLHSERPPEQNDGPVKVAVSHTFPDLVLNNEFDVLVDFYGLNCPHCVIFAPVFEELARVLRSQTNLRLVKIEMSRNEVPDQDVHEYPTLKLFPAKSKNNPVRFYGNRNIQELINFLRSNLGDNLQNGGSQSPRSEETAPLPDI